MNFKIKWNTPKINKLTDEAKLSLQQTTEAIKTDVIANQVVPFDTGRLQNSMFVQMNGDKAQLAFSTSYAQRVYFHPEVIHSTANNANAKSRWLDDYLKGGSKEDFAEKTFKKLYKKNGGF